MAELFKGSDLIYKVRASYSDTKEIIILSGLTAITATFCLGTSNQEYTLAGGGITIDNNLINIFIQRDDFENKNVGKWDLKIETEEIDSNFEDGERVRLGYINSAFTLKKLC